MNRKALIIGIIYSVLVIIFKMIIWLGGYTFTDYGFKFSHITTVFAIIPFLYLAIKLVRDKENGGYIGGRDAIRVALIVVGVSAIILSIYNYIEFQLNMDAFKEYYRSEKYLSILQKDPKAKEIGYEKIIEFQIANLSAFKATTAKLFPFVLLSFSFSFITAVFMKRRPAN